MKAKFIGKNDSMGFKNGVTYKIRTKVGTIGGFGDKKAVLWVISSDGLRCPYESLEKMLENWELISA